MYIHCLLSEAEKLLDELGRDKYCLYCMNDLEVSLISPVAIVTDPVDTLLNIYKSRLRTKHRRSGRVE